MSGHRTRRLASGVDRLAEAHELLATAVEELTSGDDWARHAGGGRAVHPVQLRKRAPDRHATAERHPRGAATGRGSRSAGRSARVSAGSRSWRRAGTWKAS